jgi:hypothetical protein
VYRFDCLKKDKDAESFTVPRFQDLNKIIRNLGNAAFVGTPRERLKNYYSAFVTAKEIVVMLQRHFSTSRS